MHAVHADPAGHLQLNSPGQKKDPPSKKKARKEIGIAYTFHFELESGRDEPERERAFSLTRPSSPLLHTRTECASGPPSSQLQQQAGLSPPHHSPLRPAALGEPTQKSSLLTPTSATNNPRQQLSPTTRQPASFVKPTTRPASRALTSHTNKRRTPKHSAKAHATLTRSTPESDPTARTRNHTHILDLRPIGLHTHYKTRIEASPTPP